MPMPTAANQPVALPLTGVRVVELGTFVTGPYAAALLGDMGADVIKIEPPRGDPMRGWSGDAYSPYFQAYNKSKRSIALDLRDEGDRDVARALIATADVLIHNYRPGVADRLGVGAEQARQLNPRLVYCRISGFGESGPYAERPSYNQVVQSLSGLDSLIVDPDRPTPVGPNFGDTVTGIFASHAILAALVRRERTGEGGVVDVTMLGSMLAFLAADVQDYLASGIVPHSGSRPSFSQSYMVEASDGLRLTVHLSSPEKFWKGLLAAVERSELADDPRFATWADRKDHYAELRDELRATFARRPRADWLRRLDAHDVPAAPLNDIAKALVDPQVIQLDAVVQRPGEGSPRTIVASPARIDDQPMLGRPAPRLAEHADAIRAELGLGAA
ncbi:CaiB/BaiF CoA transferase family protein [Jiangella alkaliphila]|uniref:Formyl-CoA transferase n=1 Tax=Jiangella alkaliphila TaxID=419479 RepID=A0A1H2LEA8_9ACTN|nr:CoA transferase [Jiangella alkaliphila]SDU79065.1 formyl-CoA transferase [Jiangella alkaliphila]